MTRPPDSQHLAGNNKDILVVRDYPATNDKEVIIRGLT